MAFNEENIRPPGDDADISMESVKAGAAVFGSLVFGTEFPDHSLTYSPSPLVNRCNKENIQASQPSMDSSYLESKKVLDFDKPVASPKKRKEKVPHKKAEGAKPEKNKSNNIIKPRDAIKRKLALKTRSDNVMSERIHSGESVNPVINDVRRSKEESIMEKQLTAAEIREQRRLEKQEAEAFNAEAERTRREVLELRKQLSERFRRAKVDRQKKLRDDELSKVENEIQFKSMVHVEHKKTIKEMEDSRRRMSMDARAKLRQNHREGKERLRLAAIQEDQAIYEERHESSIAIRNTKASNAEQRRKSFAFRNGDARRIRELHKQMEREKQQQEHESYELKWAGERDADEYKKQMAKERRDSLAFRNAEGKSFRDKVSQMKADELHKEHKSYELKWAGERDADEYKKQMDEERRKSFAFRNAEGVRIRDMEAQMKADDHRNEHDSYELKWAGERDADEYKKQTAQERRDSLAFRNAEGKRIRDKESKMKSDDLQNEHESYELKWAGERDADEYKKQLAAERRESFAFRNADGKRIRDLESQMKCDNLHHEHESYELKWAGERDADEYKKQMAKERRDSLAFRNAEGKSFRDKVSQMKADELHKEHESYELKWAGERDADEYKKQMDEERRKSFAFRNAEGVRIRDMEAQMKADDHRNEHDSYELKWAGERDADNYRKEMAKERRDSLAFRNAEGKRIRDIEAQMKADDLQDEHEGYELKWAGERDAEEYKKQLAKERRESLAFRNAEAARHEAVMNELLSLAKEREHESYVLKWAGENDAKKYIADQEELRRRSLAYRNAEGRRHREIEEEMRMNEIAENAKNEELAADCQRDVQKYKADCAERDRASLCLRGKEKFSNRMKEENDRQMKLEEDHESHLLDTAAWQDVNEYVKECNRRKRLSLAFRAKEKRRHFQYAKQQRELKVQQQHADTNLRSEDARYIEMAKLKEKARVALESFKQTPNCSFGTNPFETLLR